MPEEKKRKDFWDKLQIVLAPVGGLLAAIAVAAVGIAGSHVLERRQSIDTNARLYSELMSRREESESSLRKDMFGTIIQAFIQGRSEDLDAKVLNLELLAYNFHDSLNLKPIFRDLQRRLRIAPASERAELTGRVQRVAREIAAKQLFALEGHGRSFRRTVDLEELGRQGRAGVPLDGESIAVEGKRCEIALRVLSADPAQQQLRVRLEVKAATEDPTAADARAAFDVGWFDFPMIDNTRLANGLRCAVSMGAFSATHAELVTVCFPGEYASLKDRPYYDEVIQKLQEAAGASK